MHDWAKVKEKCSVMLPKRDNTMVEVSRQQVNQGGFQVVVMGEVPSKEVDMVECLAKAKSGKRRVLYSSLGVTTHSSLATLVEKE